MTVSIVTCWMGHHELAEDYEAAVVPELRDGDELHIVDNGDAPTFRRGIFHKPLPIRNLGFAKGSNYGLLCAKGDVVVMLNNDIALGYDGWLDEIRQAVEPGVLVGPLRSDRHSAVDGQHMPYIDGWCLAGMRDDLMALGGFDEGLQEPAYYSDNMLCLEARAVGMTLRELRPGLTHKLNVTAGPAANPDVQAASAANRARYIARARELLVAA